MKHEPCQKTKQVEVKMAVKAIISSEINPRYQIHFTDFRPNPNNEYVPLMVAFSLLDTFRYSGILFIGYFPLWWPLIYWIQSLKTEQNSQNALYPI